MAEVPHWCGSCLFRKQHSVVICVAAGWSSYSCVQVIASRAEEKFAMLQYKLLESVNKGFGPTPAPACVKDRLCTLLKYLPVLVQV